MSEHIMKKNVQGEVLEYVLAVQQHCANLTGMANDILNFSKIDAARLTVPSGKYHAASMIGDAINLVRARLKGKSVEFFVKLDSGIPEFLVGHGTHVRQILINLLGNAVKHTKSGYIILSVEQEMMGEERRLSIKVEDSGAGIKKEKMSELFMDFSGVDGTKLGLSIARVLCRAMGGDVTVNSERGRGSTFTATVIQSSCGDKKIAEVSNAEEKRVLVFEERPLYLDAVTHALSSLGVRATYVSDMAGFTSEIEREKYDHVFVSSVHVVDCVFAISRDKHPLIVNMAKLWEGHVLKGVKSIAMPVFCVGVANILNGSNEDYNAFGSQNARVVAA